MKIVFATNNEHKLREVRQILDGKYEVLSLADIGCHADIPETADTLDGNALQKARYVYERYGIDVFADDTGLEVEALDGAPGVHTARYAGEAHDTKANVDLLLHNMQGKANRHACFRTAIALIQGGEEHLFEGRVDGEITETRIGETGFGYDPVFRPDGYDGTFAELGEEVKNGISHRARAVAQLVKYLGVLLIALLPSGLLAQIIGEWTLHPAYGDAQQMVAADGTLWCVSSGNLWMLDLASGEMTTFDRTCGLNDHTITHIAYSDAAHKVVLVYENSNIDIIDIRTNDVSNIAVVKQSDNASKDINHVCVHGNEAWLATAFGIVVVNLDGCYVHHSYTYSMGVNAVAIGIESEKEYLYVATPKGIYRRDMAGNLYDTSSITVFSPAVVNDIVWWNNRLIASGTDNKAQSIDTHGNAQPIAGVSKVNTIVPWGDDLLIASSTAVTRLTANGQTFTLEGENKYAKVMPIDATTLAVADGYNGMRTGKVEDNRLNMTEGGYAPNGPLNDNVYRLRYHGTRLMYVCGGCNYDYTITGNAAGWMDNGIWTNVEMQPITQYEKYAGLTDIAEDPFDADHHYVSSVGHGLLEFKGTKMVNRYTSNNSLLSKAASNADYYTWVESLAFDPDGRLWIGNGNVDTVIVSLDQNGKWERRYLDDMKMTAYLSTTYIHDGYIWYVSEYHPDLSKIGILCIDTRGTYGNANDDRVRWHNNPIVQQDGQSYTVQHIFDIKADSEGQLWVGTDMGLFVISSVDDYMQRSFTYHQVKVNRNDGSGLADYLLSGIWVTAIEVDAADRKWIGTDGQGVYLVSADGQEELEHFTTDNSPLPSDHITSLAYDDQTGTLAIGTQKGIITYNTNSLMAAETLDEDNIIAYPNPVPPDYHRPVTIKGMTNDCEVKIASVTGRVVYVTRSNGGMAQWNLCNSRGQRVATGVYYVICTDTDGTESIVTRIVVTN